MSQFEFIIAIVLIVFIFKLVQTRMNHKHEQSKQGMGEATDLLDRLGQLEERIRVLERIITDDRANLRREFRDLGK